MIEPMKIVHIVTAAKRKGEMLSALRDAGILHIAKKRSASAESILAFNTLSGTKQRLTDFQADPKHPVVDTEPISDEAFDELNGRVLAALDERERMTAVRGRARMEADKLAKWGDFVPSELRELKKSGIDIHVYRMGKKELETLAGREDISYIRLAPVEKNETVAVLGALEKSFPANEFVLPDKGYGELTEEAEAADARVKACEELLQKAALHIPAYEERIAAAKERMEYAAAGASADGDSDLVWLSGYIPAAEEASFRETAAANGWAFVLDDPAEDDGGVPTKLRFTKITRLIEPVLNLLGTVPGYREFDISLWFLLFFSLFFAMIIGDAGYGVIILILAVVLHIRSKKATNLILLMYVVSAATIAWGAVTGTWFGTEAAMRVPFLRSLVIPAIANYPGYFGVSVTAQQNTVMKFCFSIGAVQLSLACVMNVFRKIGQKNWSWIADIGWLFSILSLYFMVLFLVTGATVDIKKVAIAVGCGFGLVVLFGGMAPGKTFFEGLKSGLGGLFTTFLDTISAFGNIMSYIRLFAVGMASLAIAQSFNDMAAGFSGGAVVAGVIIVIIGHALNFVMGLLSVVVHGVRLNLMEFSGQLGMEWAGVKYEPFQKLNK